MTLIEMRCRLRSFRRFDVVSSFNSFTICAFEKTRLFLTFQVKVKSVEILFLLSVMMQQNGVEVVERDESEKKEFFCKCRREEVKKA